MKWLSVIIGSIAGGTARYGASLLAAQTLPVGFPYGTLLVNLSGCLLIGIFSGLAERNMLVNPELRILLTTGFCGAFTTFSTFILESASLARAGGEGKAFLNVGLSVIFGYLLFRLGETLVVQ